ncbi:hypothetical protein AKJ59_00190 [candidate division MSBL1 archaeon SCGC-AAA385M02]|uniref:Uncharacterized protein n=1 Tax=candidate division MSBL1 archaeon SCGC-AAA385M02 TaxID=1698287 RepID=A0A133VR80_9EURY|nr:hypothetical protein AKJ59_00190 [candidate division MSBL1 archaeon SCGC-AAA385M02]
MKKNPKEVMDKIRQYYSRYDEGVFNDVSFVGCVYDLCKEYLEAELNKIEGRDAHIREYLGHLD